MNSAIKIPSTGTLDFLSLGALGHRLDPGLIPFRKATHCDIHVSGGEFNVTVQLDITQGLKVPGKGREKRIGDCSATFHVTPKAHHKEKKQLRTQKSA